MATKQDIEGIHYLSPLQQGLLFHAVAEQAADPYLMQVGFVLQGELDSAAFHRAWLLVAKRHPSLRSAFAWQGVKQPVQVVRPIHEVPLVQHDLRGLSEHERAAALERFLSEDRAQGIDLLK